MKRNAWKRLVLALITGVFVAGSSASAIAGAPALTAGAEQEQDYGDQVKAGNDTDADEVLEFATTEEPAVPYAPFEYEHAGFNGAQSGSYPGGRPGP